MPADIGNQTITLKYYDEATTANVNQRFEGIRPLGIYHGGYLTKTDDTHVNLSPLVCEISDSNHQVKAQTATLVSVVVASATPYIVLRWQYTGDPAQDYMGMLAVSSPSSTDLIVGKCIYAGSVITGITYVERANPDVTELFLRVEATEETELRVRVRAGWYQTEELTVAIPDQKTSQFVSPGANSKTFLVFVNNVTGVIELDSSGVEDAAPVAPDYDQRMVIAEVTIASTTTNITQAMIRDVRPFMTPAKSPVSVDGITITKNPAGELQSHRGFLELHRWDNIYLDGVSGGSPSTGSSIVGSFTHGLSSRPDFVTVNVYNPATGQRVAVDQSQRTWGTDGGTINGCHTWDATAITWFLAGGNGGYTWGTHQITASWRVEIIAGYYKFS